ncbi:recombinase family protein [Vibrio sp. 99-70-13A1]|uniref:recombinase family protein n=1 Tax=Vibrio sp. 99-70-13A1 TaxID=2607601 RepID=UPI001493C825|nr:recombinase family protein [Vibrio sp. 99-70-13A1]NOH99427.1 recombinase family protein [Vibrio sp. 99-70-13A1]
MQFIYSRVSTVEQNVQQQTEFLAQSYKHDAVFEDKFSGKDLERPEILKMLSKLRSGDSVVFYDISRLGRNTQGVLEFCEKMNQEGVKVIVHTLGGIDITSSTGKLVLTTLAAVAEMQRTEMLEKQRIGIERAKREGRYKGKQVAESSVVEYRKVIELVDLGMSQTKAIAIVGMNKSKYYRLKRKIRD